MAERNAVGTFSPVVYFESPCGEISLPGTADQDQRGSNGWIRREACTLDQVDRLQRKLEEQDRRELRTQLERDEMALEEKRKKIRESLLRSMTSSQTSHYEKEFIREYLAIADERKRKFYQQDKKINSYFMARELDDAGKGLIQE
jgi:hypothetical protein